MYVFPCGHKLHTLQYSESLTGSVFMTSNDGPFMSLQNSLQEVFSQQNYNCCLLTIGINTVAIFKTSQQSFKIFYSHSRDLHGMPHSFGTCTLLSNEGLENFVSYLQLSCLQTGLVPFEIKGVLISDSQSAQKRRIKFEIIKPPHVRISDLFCLLAYEIRPFLYPSGLL